jgi:hypothetical protein
MPAGETKMSDGVKDKKYITRMIGGTEVDVPLDECWDSICKVLRIARMLTCPGGEKHQEARLAFLAERLSDLESYGFHYVRHPMSINLREEFVPAGKP